jgi:hypothetical protein
MAHISLRVSFAKCSERVSTIHIIDPLFPQFKKGTEFYPHSNQAPHIMHLQYLFRHHPHTFHVSRVSPRPIILRLSIRLEAPYVT